MSLARAVAREDGSQRAARRPTRQTPARLNDEGVLGCEVRVASPPSAASGGAGAGREGVWNVFHHVGSRKIEVNMAQLMPAAQTLPRLAMPALEDRMSEAKPATVVAPASNKARPTEALTTASSP